MVRVAVVQINHHLADTQYNLDLTEPQLPTRRPESSFIHVEAFTRSRVAGNRVLVLAASADKAEAQ